MGFKDVLHHLDREETHVVIRLEARRFGKPMTVIEGLDKSDRDLAELATLLKRRLATGGTTKEGLVLLQGDHRDHVKDELVKLGYPQENIEVL